MRLDVLTLPSGIEQAMQVDEPIVWVDMVLGDRRAQTLPIAITGGTYPVFLQNVTLRVWKDAQRTQAATVTNLPVVVRQRMAGFNTTPAQEYVTTYYVNGSSTLVEPNFVAVQNVYTEQPARIDVFDRSIQLDPGEGYSILR